MNKTVLKFRPNNYLEIGEHESWLADMAAKGLYLEKMGIIFAKFVKGEPENMRYRIDVSTKKSVDSDQIHKYAESGWDYVTSYGLFHVFSSPAELDAPELYSNPVEQAYTLKELDKNLALKAVISTFGMLLITALLSSIWFLDGTPYFFMVEGGAITHLIIIISFGYSSYTLLQAASSIRSLRKMMIEGKPIDHHAPWKKNHRLQAIIGFILTVLLGLGASIPLIQMAKVESKTLTETSFDLPIIRLADVEKNPALLREEASFMSGNVDRGNQYTYEWSPLAPVQYDTNENGVVPGEMWKDGSGEYTPSITSKVYQLRIPIMADHLISDLIKKYIHDDSEEFMETRHPEFDLLIVHENAKKKEVFAAKGKAVIHVRYYGYAELNSVIENIVEKINLLAD
ncbi:DUF2812 domain-containing protein [Bacillus sp. 2205SS5-2]|uniref:DUF2812 domain-containing protein n=1 Tax=Bacillus sp. 2205SS5-2 TaxID=3109031 RepID=UPI0030046FA4